MRKGVYLVEVCEIKIAVKGVVFFKKSNLINNNKSLFSKGFLSLFLGEIVVWISRLITFGIELVPLFLEHGFEGYFSN